MESRRVFFVAHFFQVKNHEKSVKLPLGPILIPRTFACPPQASVKNNPIEQIIPTKWVPTNYSWS